MSFNVGELMFNIIKILKDLTQKLYEVVNYQVDITFVTKVMDFFGASLQLPNTISLISLIGGVSAVTLVIIIIYNIFKL